MDLVWEGEGIEEKGRDSKTGKILVLVNPKYFRPAEVELLLGDCSNAEKKLGWKREVSFEQLVEEMVQHDLELNQ